MDNLAQGKAKLIAKGCRIGKVGEGGQSWKHQVMWAILKGFLKIESLNEKLTTFPEHFKPILVEDILLQPLALACIWNSAGN